MSRYTLPSPARVKNLLNGVLAAPVDVKESKRPADPKTLSIMAVYEADDGEVSAVCLCDLMAANCTGAALSMIPSAVVDDNIKAGTIDGTILDNLHEIFNIAVNLFSSPCSSRLRLRDVILPGASTPADVAPVLASPERLDVKIDVSRYGSGLMRLLAV